MSQEGDISDFAFVGFPRAGGPEDGETGDRKRNRMSQESDYPLTGETMDSSSSSYSRGTFGRTHHKYIRPRKYSYHRRHKKMPRRLRAKRAPRRKSGSIFYYDKVEHQKFLKPSVGRRWTAILKDDSLNKWSSEYGPVNSVEDANALTFGLDKNTATDTQLLNRRTHGYRGRGSYSFGKMWRRSGLGRTAAGVGRKLLEGAGNMISSKMGGSGLYTGRGLYHSNNLIGGGGGDIAHIASAIDETGAVTVSHTEYLTDVYAPGVAGSGIATAFYNQSIPLNPALGASFPFLSQIAQNYDEYEFVSLIFSYRSTTTDIGNSTNGQCGTIIMSTQYNAAAQPFTDKQSMLEYAHAHDCKVTEHMQHGVECDPEKLGHNRTLYTRANPVVTGQDLKTYDHGIFQYALANLPSSYNGLPVGEMWVSYVCRLAKPKLFVTRGLDIDTDLFTVAQNSNISLKRPLSSGTLLKGQQNNIGCLLTDIAPGTAIGGVTFTGGGFSITIPATYTGALRLTYSGVVNTSTASSLAQANLTASTTGNIAYLYDLYDGAALDPINLVFCPLPAAAAVGSNFNLVIDLFVKASTSGINNTVNIGWNALDATPLLGAWMMQISQYQSQGLVSATDRLTWINAQNQVVNP